MTYWQISHFFLPAINWGISQHLPFYQLAIAVFSDKQLAEIVDFFSVIDQWILHFVPQQAEEFTIFFSQSIHEFCHFFPQLIEECCNLFKWTTEECQTFLVMIDWRILLKMRIWNVLHCSVMYVTSIFCFRGWGKFPTHQNFFLCAL